ncbi:MAG: glycoside hydrolase family 3 N-terminal domain-containing protein, partial [Bacteroidota bacterium]
MRFLLLALLPFLAALDGCREKDGNTTDTSSNRFTEKPAADALYRDADEPTADRIADLINRMTLEEKVAQVTAVWADKKKMYGPNFSFDPDSAAVRMPLGIGHVTRPSERQGPPEPGRTGAEEVTYLNTLQKWMVEETRLGIPALAHEESLHGLAATNATSWGQPISVAATFNRDLTRQLYTIAARQTASRGGHVVLTPVVDVARDPRWGRVEETFGEDFALIPLIIVALEAEDGLEAELGG